MGKLRRYTAYISISCSGPEQSSVLHTPIGRIRSRAGADLRYTTSDADSLYRHFSSPNADSGPRDIHIRLVNPRLRDVHAAISDASTHLNAFAGQEHWAGGCLQLIYAGHGSRGNGALVFPDGELRAEDYLHHVAAHTKVGKYRRRLDIVLDSCFSGAFITTLLANAFESHASTLFPCSLLSVALHNEYAWEYPSYGHGIWTAAFLQQLKSPSLSTTRLQLLAHSLWRRLTKKEQKQLYNGGVSYMTAGNQHSFGYENGMFTLDNAGSFGLPESDQVDAAELQQMLEHAVR